MKTFLAHLGGARFVAVKEEERALALAMTVRESEEKGDLPSVEAVGYRPMELLLLSLSACSFVDLLSILAKQRFKVSYAYVVALGERAKTIPSRFIAMQLEFKLGFKLEKQSTKVSEEEYLKKAQGALKKAAALSVMKYCSVSASLNPAIKLTTFCQASLTRSVASPPSSTP